MQPYTGLSDRSTDNHTGSKLSSAEGFTVKLVLVVAGTVC